MINIFFGFWRKVSVLFLALVILFCYTNLPENIAIIHDLNGKPQKFIDKQQFFYWAVGTVFLFNFLFSLLENQIQKINFELIFPQSKWATSTKALKDLLKGWVNAFIAVINTFLVFVILGINNINGNKGQVLDFNYNWLLIVGVILLMLLIFSLPLRLLFSNPTNSDN
jgi:hypothetical protein